MFRPRCLAVARRALLVASLVALAAAPVRADESDWMPLRSGRRLVYEVHRDHSYQPENASIDRVFHKGRSVQTFRDAAAVAAGAVAVEERVRLDPVQVGTREDTSEVRVLADRNGLVILGSGAVVGDLRNLPFRYEPPLRLLPNSEPGESWSVGTYKEGESRIELRGQVIGVGKLADPPGCESCLQVRYEGPITGSIPVHGGKATIESGRIERTVWMKRGVGIVREVANVTTAIALPDGTRAKTSHVLTLRLVEDSIAP